MVDHDSFRSVSASEVVGDRPAAQQAAAIAANGAPPEPLHRWAGFPAPPQAAASTMVTALDVARVGARVCGAVAAPCRGLSGPRGGLSCADAHGR